MRYVKWVFRVIFFLPPMFLGYCLAVAIAWVLDEDRDYTPYSMASIGWPTIKELARLPRGSE